MKFYNAIDNRNNFVIGVGNNPMNQFAVFAKGFAHAAATLAEDLLAREHGFRNHDAYPVVFLYRHSLELYLKNLLYKPALLFAFRGMQVFESKLWNNHRLKDLSEGAAKILRTLFPNDRELEQLTQRTLCTSAEFAEIDPGSYSYRYPIDSQGNRSTTLNQIVNLESFHRTLSQLLADLEVVDFGLDVETHIAREEYENTLAGLTDADPEPPIRGLTTLAEDVDLRA